MRITRIYPVAALVIVFAAMSMTAPLANATPGAAPAPCALPKFGPGANYQPTFNAASFSADVTNPYFPLVVGRALVYTGTKDGKSALNIFTTTARTLEVDQVITRVVEDRLYLDNVLAERTSDYYAQDRCGNVWYFGEDTATLDAQGNVISTSGTFHAGVNGAQPGVFMQADPTLGRRFRQEWAPGEAEDTFRALSLDSAVSVPFGSFRHALKTAETTDLEVGVVDNKFYVKGIGEVVEMSVHGPVESLRLVEIIS